MDQHKHKHRHRHRHRLGSRSDTDIVGARCGICDLIPAEGVFDCGVGIRISRFGIGERGRRVGYCVIALHCIALHCVALRCVAGCRGGSRE